MNTYSNTPHSFHIPVLGLGFSIDTPLKVAKYGISSVASIIEDELIEDMRKHYSSLYRIPFLPITTDMMDYRARRITAYLNMMQKIITEQMAAIKALPFEKGNELEKYFLLLPASSAVQVLYFKMIGMAEGAEKLNLQIQLKKLLQPGSIDVNIMAKVDNARYAKDGTKMPSEYSDALSALRGFANSKLAASIVFSAGYNPRLYAYVEQFADFFPNEDGTIRKKIVLKVSDYRSALVQGKIFAKKGVWISEFRVESGLNCGGHAFPTDGILLGPILEEFKQNRLVLYDELYSICTKAWEEKGITPLKEKPLQKLAVQGGIGTAQEQQFLLNYYCLDSVGWGSPFLLVPEATNVDEVTLNQLATAKQDDYYLSNASPLGVPFNNFKTSSSEVQRKTRIEKKRPGSPCYKNYLASNTEFTEVPICTASRKYQHLKTQQIKSSHLTETEQEAQIAAIAEKDCLCEGLTSSARLTNDLEIPHKLSAVAICPGPNLAFFSGVFSLKDMVDHIYGRKDVLNTLQRSHVFVNELKLYIDYYKNKIAADFATISDNQKKHYQKCKTNLLNGIGYYITMLNSDPSPFAGMFTEQLREAELKQLQLQVIAL